MRIRHIGVVTGDLEKAATFYEKALGLKRLGPIRTPSHYPGKAIDRSDGEDREQNPPRFFKFLDPDGVEIDVATLDRSWKF